MIHTQTNIRTTALSLAAQHTRMPSRRKSLLCLFLISFYSYITSLFRPFPYEKADKARICTIFNNKNAKEFLVLQAKKEVFFFHFVDFYAE